MGWTVTARGRTGDFVIRVDHWNRSPGFFGGSSLATVLEPIERAVRRDHSFTLRVRRAADDPFGPTIHEEPVRERSEVVDAIARTEERLRSGEIQ